MRSYTLGFKNAGSAEQRRDKRLRLPIFSVKIGNRRYDSINWSLGGMLVGGYDGYLFQGLKVVIQVRLRDMPAALEKAAGDLDEEGLVVEALVIRHDLEKRELALKFQRLTPTILDFFERSFGFHQTRQR
ncbi:hypothetical protein [Dongia sp.]|uniref:hypothetical protein n=1 Tax=Dongia sp. TaxID=1977262 RepID=UPI0035B47756